MDPTDISGRLLFVKANKQDGRVERLETVPFLTGLTPYPLQM